MKDLYELLLFIYNLFMERKTVKLLGFAIDTFSLTDAVSYAIGLIKDKKGAQVVTINPEMIEFASKNSDFANILHNADLVVPDGVGIKIGLKIKGTDIERVAGIEFSKKLIVECAKNNLPIALVGAKPHIIEKAAQNLKSEIQNLNIVYIQDGYFQDEQRILTELSQNSPSLVLVALGSPRQEEFIVEARKLLPEAVMVGVGGSFDVWSGEVERAPEIFQKLGLEWLYRTVKEPKRFKRIFPNLPMFVFRVLFSK